MNVKGLVVAQWASTHIHTALHSHVSLLSPQVAVDSMSLLLTLLPAPVSPITAQVQAAVRA